jgi:hypothetical protein
MPQTIDQLREPRLVAELPDPALDVAPRGVANPLTCYYHVAKHVRGQSFETRASPPDRVPSSWPIVVILDVDTRSVRDRATKTLGRADPFGAVVMRSTRRVPFSIKV